jgi:hypothetical protein
MGRENGREACARATKREMGGEGERRQIRESEIERDGQRESGGAREREREKEREREREKHCARTPTRTQTPRAASIHAPGLFIP